MRSTIAPQGISPYEYGWMLSISQKGQPSSFLIAQVSGVLPSSLQALALYGCSQQSMEVCSEDEVSIR